MFKMIPLVALIPGLEVIPDYLSQEAQQVILKSVDQQPWITDLKRRVQHYGYRYDYTRRKIVDSLFLGPLPDWILPIAQRVNQDGWIVNPPDQVIVNEYLPGQGIASHVDCVPCFSDTIIIISLGSQCVMNFTHVQTGKTTPLLLEVGSLVVMRGEARYEWKHGIPARKTDIYQGVSLARGRRVSLTFRKVLRA
jgi:alkylated DNA repair dioxygenase AlkB